MKLTYFKSKIESVVKVFACETYENTSYHEYFYELNVFLHAMEFDTYGYYNSQHVMLIFPAQCG